MANAADEQDGVCGVASSPQQLLSVNGTFSTLSPLKASIVHPVHSPEKTLFIGMVTGRKVNSGSQRKFGPVQLNVKSSLVSYFLKIRIRCFIVKTTLRTLVINVLAPETVVSSGEHCAECRRSGGDNVHCVQGSGIQLRCHGV